MPRLERRAVPPLLATSGEANSAISASKYFELALSNTFDLQIPNTDLTATVMGCPMLLTIVGGAIIAIEATILFIFEIKFQIMC
jgi:hypothetical protein